MVVSEPASTGKKVLLLSCSGGANVGQIADEAVRKIMYAGKGEMYCLAGIASHQDEFLDKTRGADLTIVVDGCDKECGRKVMDHCGIGDYEYLRIIDLGIRKAKPLRPEDAQIKAAAERIEALL